MPDLTQDQQRAVDWMKARGGKGFYKGAGVLMIGSEQAPFSRAMINALAQAGAIKVYREEGAMVVECL